VDIKARGIADAILLNAGLPAFNFGVMEVA
jgi:hypothetical protein